MKAWTMSDHERLDEETLRSSCAAILPDWPANSARTIADWCDDGEAWELGNVLECDGNDGADVIERMTRLRPGQLLGLRLRECNIDGAQLHHIVGSPPCSELVALDVSYCDLGGQLDSLASLSPTVKLLWLDACKLEDEDVLGLTKVKLVGGLARLSLANNANCHAKPVLRLAEVFSKRPRSLHLFQEDCPTDIFLSLLEHFADATGHSGDQLRSELHRFADSPAFDESTSYEIKYQMDLIFDH